MTLNEFISKYDNENAIVLLEGKRLVAEHETKLLVQLGELLATKTKNMMFRSGNADGSDYYFSLGVTSVDRTRLEVITPYDGHRKKTNLAYETISLGGINLVADSEVVYQSKSNKKFSKLVDQYVDGKRDQYSIKAAYIIRDTMKALGYNEIKPATFGIYYDDLSNPKQGGTGHTMNVCNQNDIPIIDQSIWFDWLKE